MRPPHLAHRLLIAAAALGLLTACPNGGKYPAPEPRPSAQSLLDKLKANDAKIGSFQAASRMDYRDGNNRLKVTVLVMGERGAKVRFNAENPTGGNVAADLACDGVSFNYVDYNNNCVLSGPCNGDAIGQLLRIQLEPDDFLSLAIGTTPVLDGATGSVTWDSKNGNEIVQLASADKMWTQRIVISGRSGSADVLSSTVTDKDGKTEWKITNKNFKTVKLDDGGDYRVPGRTRFEQPKTKGDVIVRWEERTLNPQLDASKFVMELPAGVPECGAKKP